MVIFCYWMILIFDYQDFIEFLFIVIWFIFKLNLERLRTNIIENNSGRSVKIVGNCLI